MNCTYDDYDNAVPDCDWVSKCRRVCGDGIILKWQHKVNQQCRVELYFGNPSIIVYMIGKEKLRNNCGTMDPAELTARVHDFYEDFQRRHFAMAIMNHIVTEAVAEFQPQIVEWPMYLKSCINKSRLDLTLGKTVASVLQWDDKISLLCYDGKFHPLSEAAVYLTPKFQPLELSDPDVIPKFRAQFLAHFRQPTVLTQIEQQRNSITRQIAKLQAKMNLFQTQLEQLHD